MKRVADLRAVLRFSRIVAIGRVANQTIGRADGKHDLGEVWCERDDSVDPRGQRYGVSGIVGNLPYRGTSFLPARACAGQGQQKQKRDDQDREPSELNLA